MVVEAVEVVILWEAEAATLVGAEVGEAEVEEEVAHQEVVLAVFRGDSPLEEVVIHPETKGCWAQHQKYSMEAGRISTASYSHSVSIGR